MILPVTVKQSLLLLSVFCTVNMFAQVKLPVVFCNDMVLQWGKPVKIWGTALDGEQVTAITANAIPGL